MQNTWVGNYAGDGQTTANNCVAVGYEALTGALTGGNNVAVGVGAASAMTSGTDNTCIGHAAGNAITTGTNNVLVGMNNDVSGSGNVNVIGIGTNQTSLDSNAIYFGRASNQTYKSTDSGTTWSFASDERIKKDIADENMGLSFINRLQPRTFKWKASQDVPESLTSQYDKDKNHKDTTSTFHGFIAQEVKAAMDSESISNSFLAWNERSDGTQGVAMGEFIIPLINAVKELSAEIDKLKGE